MKTRNMKRIKSARIGPIGNSWSTGRTRGRQAGNREGWLHGYHMGRCTAILRQIRPDIGILFNKKIMFVTSGLGYPYSPIDQSVIKELRGLAREAIVVKPTQNVIAIAAKARPDLVLVLNGCNFFPVKFIDKLRSMQIKTAIWLTDDPYYTDLTVSIVPHYNYVFTIELSCVNFYMKLGCKQVHYLPLGINPQHYHPRHIYNTHRHDICFIGSAFWKRVRMLDPIAPYLAQKNSFISGWWWYRLKNFNLLRRKIHSGWLSPHQTANYYNGAKIVINIHRDHNDQSYNRNSRKIPALSLNPRTFEVSACGAFQLTDVRHDLAKFYKPGVEIATYSSPQELVQKIEYYLKHDTERREIALRGFLRTMTDHTYRKRLTQMLQVIFGPLH